MRTIVAILFSLMALTFGCGDTSVPEGLPMQYQHNTFNADGSVEIDVYVDDELMDVRVFPDENSSNIGGGAYNIFDFTLADPIMQKLGITCEIDEDADVVTLSSEAYGESDFSYSKSARMIDGSLYIVFVQFRVHTDGSMKQRDSEAMYLYSGNYERSDLPETLEDCYAMLDETLSEEDIAFIKNAADDDMAGMHFGLGMWIRNEWLYPTQSKLSPLLQENGINHIDDASALILEGYRRYLNGEPCGLDDLADEFSYDYE